MALDEGGFSEIGSRMLDEHNSRKRTQAFKEENERLKNIVNELLEALEKLLEEYNILTTHTDVGSVGEDGNLHYRHEDVMRDINTLIARAKGET